MALQCGSSFEVEKNRKNRICQWAHCFKLQALAIALRTIWALQAAAAVGLLETIDWALLR